jgi:hypothetical protein
VLTSRLRTESARRPALWTRFTLGTGFFAGGLSCGSAAEGVCFWSGDREECSDSGMVTGSGALSEAGEEGGGRAGAGAGAACAGRHRLTEARNPLRPAALGPTQVLPIAAGDATRTAAAVALDAGGEGLVGSGWIAGCGEREGRNRGAAKQRVCADDVWAQRGAGLIVSGRSMVRRLEPSDTARRADRRLRAKSDR